MRIGKLLQERSNYDKYCNSDSHIITTQAGKRRGSRLMQEPISELRTHTDSRILYTLSENKGAYGLQRCEPIRLYVAEALIVFNVLCHWR